MRVPKNFKTRIGGNFYENTEKLIVCRDQPILSVHRDDDTGELRVQLVVFDSSGRRKAKIEGTEILEGDREAYSTRLTEHCYKVRECATGRTICEIRRCAATREMDLDVFVLTHTPDGFFIHANPLQTNIGNQPSGETFRNADAALVVR